MICFLTNPSKMCLDQQRSQPTSRYQYVLFVDHNGDLMITQSSFMSANHFTEDIPE